MKMKLNSKSKLYGQNYHFADEIEHHLIIKDLRDDNSYSRKNCVVYMFVLSSAVSLKK